MNLIKRVRKSIKVKWGRSLLLFAVSIAILIFVLAGLAIRSAVEEAANQAQREVGATVILSANREASFKKQEQISSSGSTTEERPNPGGFSLTPVSLTDVEKITELDNIKNCSFENSASAMAEGGITAIISSDSSEDSSETTDAGGKPTGGVGGNPRMTQASFQVSDVSATAQSSNFSDGTTKITDSEGIDDSDKGTNNVVIDPTLAEISDLAIGDTFTITSTEDGDTTYEMTIKGIYESSETSGSMGMKFNFMNPSNILYASYTFANKLNGTSDDNMIDPAIYTLSDPDKMDEFLKGARKLIDTGASSL